ncbi:MAG: hypothetical protein JWP41_196, partial [Ramlibacter sp.]|nr:hypothetical protein [Ramlibacter sp.]
MTEMQPTTQSSAAAMPVMLDSFASSAFDDSDYPLGCECADPSLQIERWGQEA